MKRSSAILALVLFCLTACRRESSPEQSAAVPGTSPVDQSPTYKGRRLSLFKWVNVGDRTLADWSEDYKVLEIPASQAASLQWQTIRGSDPKPVGANQFQMKVYMAWDSRNWYVASKAKDDELHPVSSSSLYPYTGDCVELYFVGAEPDSAGDFHRLVAQASPQQSAFLQLEVPAA